MSLRIHPGLVQVLEWFVQYLPLNRQAIVKGLFVSNSVVANICYISEKLDIKKLAIVDTIFKVSQCHW